MLISEPVFVGSFTSFRIKGSSMFNLLLTVGGVISALRGNATKFHCLHSISFKQRGLRVDGANGLALPELFPIDRDENRRNNRLDSVNISNGLILHA